MGILKKLGNNPYFNALRNIRALLDLDQKKRGAIMLLLLFFNAGFDVLGLATLFPLIDAAMNPENIQQVWYLNYPYKWLGIQDNLTFLFTLSFIIFIVFLVKNILSLIIYYIQAKYSFNVALRLSKKMFQYYYDQGFLYINDIDSGTKADNVIRIPYNFASVYLLQSFIFSTEIVVLLIILIGIIFFNPAAIIVLVAVIVPVFVLVYYFTKEQVKEIGTKRNLLYPKAYSTVWESMAAYVDVKLVNKEQHFFDKYGDLFKKINKLDALQQGVFGKIHQRMNDVVLGLGIMVIFGFALIFKENSDEIISILGVFGIAAYRFLPSINRMMGAMLSLKHGNYIIDKLRVIKNKKVKFFKEVPSLKIKNSLTLKNISYQYPSSKEEVLKNLSFVVKKGETIGFIGSSGSGKTTLINLLLRLLKETEGHLYVDDTLINEENETAFQKSIGYVQQNVFIKDGTLIENIAFGETPEKIDSTKINEAIIGALLSDFVDAHPDGLKMQLGESGVKLSGGQKQRVGIARALYKEAEILVFDEATSALDSNTEKAITDTINNLTHLNKTILIVAHRITTLSNCNRIYELANGKIEKIYQYEDLFQEKIIQR